MQCPKCGSTNVTVQMVTESELKTKHKSIWYWIFIGWWWRPLLWIFLTIPMLLGKLFGRKDKKIVTKHKSVTVCQNCGNHWNV